MIKKKVKIPPLLCILIYKDLQFRKAKVIVG